MLGGVALAFASQPGREVGAAPTVYRGYVDTHGWYGPHQFTLRVDTLTDQADLRRAEVALVEGGQDAMFTTLGRMKPAGWLQIDQGVGIPVSVVSQRRVDGGLQVVALLNRPLSYAELSLGTDSRRHPFGIVVLDVDEDGSGSGTLMPEVRARIARDGALTFSDFSRLPYRLLRVRGEVEDRL